MGVDLGKILGVVIPEITKKQQQVFYENTQSVHTGKPAGLDANPFPCVVECHSKPLQETLLSSFLMAVSSQEGSRGRSVWRLKLCCKVVSPPCTSQQIPEGPSGHQRLSLSPAHLIGAQETVPTWVCLSSYESFLTGRPHLD